MNRLFYLNVFRKSFGRTISLASDIIKHDIDDEGPALIQFVILYTICNAIYSDIRVDYT